MHDQTKRRYEGENFTTEKVVATIYLAVRASAWAPVRSFRDCPPKPNRLPRSNCRCGNGIGSSR